MCVGFFISSSFSEYLDLTILLGGVSYQASLNRFHLSLNPSPQLPFVSPRKGPEKVSLEVIKQHSMAQKPKLRLSELNLSPVPTQESSLTYWACLFIL